MTTKQNYWVKVSGNFIGPYDAYSDARRVFDGYRLRRGSTIGLWIIRLAQDKRPTNYPFIIEN